MRVFYVDEDENNQLQTYYVKIANMIVPDEFKGYHAIEARNTEELVKKIKEHYRFNEGIGNIQLWSSSVGGMRLDTLDKIPKEHEFIWVRVSLNNINHV